MRSALLGSMAYYILRSYKLKIDPLRICEALGEQRHCFFLDSSLTCGCGLGRYSFLGADPFSVITTKGIGPFAELRKALDMYRIPASPGNPPLLAGAIGYLTYDSGLNLEKKINLSFKEAPGMPDSFFGLYNTTVIIDHAKRLLHIFSIGFPEEKQHLAKLLCEENFKKMYKLISGINTPPPADTRPAKIIPAELKSTFSKDGYFSAIKKAKQYIKDGDIYQINLSQRFEAKTNLSAFQLYRRLRRISPSYFSAYFDAGDSQIISSSPERFLRLEGDLVTTRPMKGTRPRGKNRKQDDALKKSLLESAKDKAELLMIVDLERNDLGRVCSYDSIKVGPLRELEEYSTVFQTTATVCGRMHKDKDRIDLLRACFPGGSITGCPKIRAMEIIDELEPVRRGIYTGSLGYLDFSGGMDFNILIRSILKKKDRLYFGAGGGIVADSQPEDEYKETLVKAKAMIEACGIKA